MGRRRTPRALAYVAWIVQRIPQARMGFEPRSVRKINDAGRDVIDGGVSVIAGDRRRTAERRREAEQRAPGEAAPFPLPLLGDDRWAGRAGRRDGSNGSCGWAERRQPPARTAPIRIVSRRCCDCPPARRDEGPPPRVVTHAAQALDRLRRRGELRRARRRQGEALGLPDFRQISRRRRWKAADWRNRRSRGGRKRFETGQRERRGRKRAARLRGSPPAAKVPPERPAASIGQADWRR